MTKPGLHHTGSRRRSVSQTESKRRIQKESRLLRWLGVMVFIVLAAPKMRIMVGPAPLYATDALIALLLLSANRMPNMKRRSSNSFSGLISLYLILVWMGELHGLSIYGTVLESMYLIGQTGLAISLFFTVPRLVRSAEAVTVVLKAAVAGMLCTSVITILYSLGPTRPLVMNTVLSYNFLVPSAESLARGVLARQGVAEAMRGYSLVGPSTMTTGVLGTVWGFAFLAANWPNIQGRWRIMANLTTIITPVAILMTYGRAAWFTAIVIGAMSMLFGFAKSRRNMIILLLGLGFIVYWVGWQSEWFLTERVVKTTQHTLENPYEDESTAARLLSFTQPFSHMLQNPIWLLVGTGVLGQKRSLPQDLMTGLYEDAGLSTKHSTFGMAYYCYGFVAAMTNALLMLNGLLFILKRLRRRPPKGVPLYTLTWQAFLLAWCGLLFWWIPGHALVSKPHGVIVFFFFYGFMLACDNILTEQVREAAQS